jgi:hypothetical protein
MGTILEINIIYVRLTQEYRWLKMVLFVNACYYIINFLMISKKVINIKLFARQVKNFLIKKCYYDVREFLI